LAAEVERLSTAKSPAAPLRVLELLSPKRRVATPRQSKLMAAVSVVVIELALP
jgi:hypothetical protein